MNNSRFSVCLLYPHNTRDFVKTAHCVHCFPSISTKLHGNCIGKGDSKIMGAIVLQMDSWGFFPDRRYEICSYQTKPAHVRQL